MNQLLFPFVIVLIAATTVRGQDDVASRGKVLVESQKCLDCHRIGDSGSHLGPDLSDIGSRRSLDVLRRSIVAPDEEVLPEHRQVRVVTANGAAVVGRLLNQDTFSIQLMTPQGDLRSFVKSSLREHRILTKGLMPSFGDRLTPGQLADLVGYLASLKGAEK